MSASKNSSHWGVLGEFTTTPQIYRACEKVRDAGFENWDAHTPFPVHGLDDAMGLKPTTLPWVTLIMGLTGLATATGLVVFVHSFEYPMVISGKPFFAWPAYVPIMFALTILFAAVSTVIAIFAYARLPQYHHPLFASERFDRASDDRFFISIEAKDPKYDADETMAFLKEIGAGHVELIE